MALKIRLNENNKELVLSNEDIQYLQFKSTQYCDDNDIENIKKNASNVVFKLSFFDDLKRNWKTYSKYITMEDMEDLFGRNTMLDALAVAVVSASHWDNFKKSQDGGDYIVTVSMG